MRDFILILWKLLKQIISGKKFPLEINCSLHLELPFNETVKGSIVADKYQGIYTCKKVAKSVFHDHLHFPGVLSFSFLFLRSIKFPSGIGIKKFSVEIYT